MIPPPRRFVGPCAGPCCGALPALCGSVSRRTAVIASTLLFVVRVEVSEHVLATSDTSEMLLALMSAPNVLLQRDNARCRRGGGGLQERFHPDGAEKWKTRRQPDRLGVTSRDTLAERLRRRPAKLMGSPRVGSNPTGVVLVLSSSSASRGNFGWAWVRHVQKFLHSIGVEVQHEWAACHGKQGGGRSFQADWDKLLVCAADSSLHLGGAGMRKRNSWELHAVPRCPLVWRVRFSRSRRHSVTLVGSHVTTPSPRMGSAS